MNLLVFAILWLKERLFEYKGIRENADVIEVLALVRKFADQK